MHLPYGAGLGIKTIDRLPASQGLDFLWLELTNRCNLRCVHCYTDSSPFSGDRDVLTTVDYERLLHEAYELGCRKMQFIGGEPQLNPDFHKLLVTAKSIGFDFIEVFTNLTHLAEETIGYAADNGICFATSVYSDTAAQHDAVTQVRSSHARTVKNLNRLIARGIKTRAATIVFNNDRANAARTGQFLRGLGVGHFGSGEVREFGRGQDVLAQPARLDGLCGHCWSGKLCIAPDGAAYPCVMARQWPAGNVLETSLAEIVAGRSLAATRQTIHDEVWLPRLAAGRVEQHDAAALYAQGDPKEPDRPDPKPADLCEPSTCWPCPQSCVPDQTPPPCPQACGPYQACVPDDPCQPDQGCEPHPV